MRISLHRQDFRALLLLPAELQRKGAFVWQLAEMTWRRHEALEVLDHLQCLSHAVSHIYVVAAGPKGMAVAAHMVYDPDEQGVRGGDDWLSIVAGSNAWGRDVVADFEFPDDLSWQTRTPRFAFWAYDSADYRRLRT
jgi:hypothetical protein